MKSKGLTMFHKISQTFELSKAYSFILLQREPLFDFNSSKQNDKIEILMRFDINAKQIYCVLPWFYNKKNFKKLMNLILYL